MDSLTQVLLGAAVGELVLGRKVGLRAAVCGAVAGTVPDLDVLANPFLSEIQQLEIHRGLSHSLLFCVFGAPFAGAVIASTRFGTGTNWRGWSWLIFWVFLTHIVLDCFTVYGTQVLQPFDDYRVALASIFIIDPFYTVPLLVGLILALRLPRLSSGRRIANGLGLGLSTLYLLFTLGNKAYVQTVFEDALQAQNHDYRRILVTPTALNNLLWVALAEDEHGYWAGHYSLLDGTQAILFRYFPAKRELLAGLRDQPIIERLIWFSGGYYAMEERGGVLYFNDLHLPRTDNWLSAEGNFVFRFRLLQDVDAPEHVIDIVHERPALRFSRQDWAHLVDRALGTKPALADCPPRYC